MEIQKCLFLSVTLNLLYRKIWFLSYLDCTIESCLLTQNSQQFVSEFIPKINDETEDDQILSTFVVEQSEEERVNITGLNIFTTPFSGRLSSLK